MTRRMITLLLTCVLAVAALAACATTPAITGSNTQTTHTTSPTTDATGTTTASASGATSGSVLAENSEPAAVNAGAADSAGAVQLTLQGSAIAVEGDGVTVDGSLATITAAGTYQLSGTLDDGQVVVDTDDQAPVYLILSGASISSATSAPLYVKEAAAVELVLADGTANYLNDAEAYVYASGDGAANAEQGGFGGRPGGPMGGGNYTLTINGGTRRATGWTPTARSP